MRAPVGLRRYKRAMCAVAGGPPGGDRHPVPTTLGARLYAAALGDTCTNLLSLLSQRHTLGGFRIKGNCFPAQFPRSCFLEWSYLHVAKALNLVLSPVLDGQRPSVLWVSLLCQAQEFQIRFAACMTSRKTDSVPRPSGNCLVRRSLWGWDLLLHTKVAPSFFPV